jgi:hypothetical protein
MAAGDLIQPIYRSMASLLVSIPRQPEETRATAEPLDSQVRWQASRTKIGIEDQAA